MAAEPHILDRLHDLIRQRLEERPENSYVARLAEGGLPSMGAKVCEEAGELVEAAGGSDPGHTVHEAADLLFHAWVLLAASGIEPSAVWAELEGRFGTSGLVEKASRGAGRGDGGC
ncbi:MAG: phosphoribosyl-ATP diphosphatase [Myxococcota bacterium]